MKNYLAENFNKIYNNIEKQSLEESFEDLFYSTHNQALDILPGTEYSPRMDPSNYVDRQQYALDQKKIDFSDEQSCRIRQIKMKKVYINYKQNKEKLNKLQNKLDMFVGDKESQDYKDLYNYYIALCRETAHLENELLSNYIDLETGKIDCDKYKKITL